MTRTTTSAIATSGSPRQLGKGFLAAMVTVGALAALALAAPASALAAPVLGVSSTHNPASKPVPAGTHAVYSIAVSNTGDERTNAPITVDFTAPPGLEVSNVVTNSLFGFLKIWECTTPDPQSVSCEAPFIYEIGPGEEACEEFETTCRIFVSLRSDSSEPSGPLAPTIKACGGGGVSCATASDDPVEIGPFGFHLTSFDGRVLDANGDPSTQAGSHPHTAATDFSFRTGINYGGFSGEGEGYPIGALKDATVRLPAGFVGNPRAIPTCTESQLATTTAKVNCPPESQVGVVVLDLYFNGPDPSPYEVGVFNIEVPHGLPALFGFNVLGNVTQVYGSLRTGGDYGVNVTAKNAPETLPIGAVDFTFWGVPADPSHDAQRCPNPSDGFEGCSSSAPLKPFLSLPTSCVGPVETFLDVTSWEGESDGSSFLSHDNTEPTPNPIGTDGCNAVDFSPTIEARPTTNVADSPSGLDFDLHIPQNEDPEGTAEAHIKDTTVKLPPGLVINPSAANGLGGCSPAQVDLHGKGASNCPDAAQLGTVEVDTPLLEKPLFGGVYIANPYDNPFNSLLAIYITVDDPKTGIAVKLAGKVHADPVSGRLTTTVKDSPQQPFEEFKLHFFGGAGGALRTPALCGTYATTSELTPWSAPDSGPPATPSDPWAISQAPGGGACPRSEASQPNTLDLDAGTVSPIAGSYSPFVVNLRREDGTQQFSTVTLSPPPGLIGKLAGIPACPDSALAAAGEKSGQAEKANPSCPAASGVGNVSVAAGAGPAPYNAPGKVYLSGPYKGAPLSLAIVTPATAGPFDLGTVVVRTALRIDPESARVTAISDPIPSILQGIPLDVRSAQIRLDRPSFMLNPTNCDPMDFSGSLLSTLSQSAPLTERFQVGECGRLAFKPKLGIRLRGGTKRGAHPALRAVLRMGAGGANLGSASVALPHSEFLDQAHIGTVCTRVQFAADACPAASVYGKATATSPLVDYAVTGPVYLRSSSHKLPDLVMALHGPASQPVEVDAVGRIDSVKGGIRTTFEATPDVALDTVVLEMAGGKKGLLQNSTNICQGKHLAAAEFEGQNGKASDFKLPLQPKCAKKKKARGAKAKSKHAGHRAG